MKKILSIILALLMLMTLVPVAISAAVGDVSADYTTVTGSIGISSWADFLSAVAAENGNAQSYHLTGDIAVDSTCPIAFSGTLDGCGHTVTVSEPMFADFNGTIKNMKLKGSITKTDGTNAAAVALTSTAGMAAFNITSDVDITVTCDAPETRTVEELYGAAIVCYCSSTKEVSSFANVVNEGTIKVDLKYYEDAKLVDNAGNVLKDGDGVDINPTIKPRAGGIAAIVNFADFTNCVNNGNVTCNGYQSLSAGICARSILNVMNIHIGVNFYHCVNNADITCTGVNGEAAGMSAYVGTTSYSAVYDFIGCVNTGNISGVKGAAGLASYVRGGNAQYPNIDFCINTGSISTTNRYASPFIGYCNSKNLNLKHSIDVGTLAKSGTDAADMHSSLITLGAAKSCIKKIKYNYVSNYETKLDYVVYTADQDNAAICVPVSVAKENYATAVSDVSLTELQSETLINKINVSASANSMYKYIVGPILPVLDNGDSWTYSEGKYTYTVGLKKYNIKVGEGIENGTLSINDSSLYAGEMISFTATPAEGYALLGLEFTDTNGNPVGVTGGNREYIMPAIDVTVTAIFDKAAATLTDKNDNLVGRYVTFKDAIDAAADYEGSTVKLVTDVTLTGTCRIIDGTFTIDLNGCDVTYETDTAFTVGEGVNVTFTDNSTGEAGKVTGGEDRYAIYADYGSNVIINGGEYKGNRAIYIRKALMNGEVVEKPCATVTINGGTFSTTEMITIFNVGSLEINGGKFYAGSGYVIYTTQSTTSTVINGGEFLPNAAGDSFRTINHYSSLDLSNYDGVTPITDITIYYGSDVAAMPTLPAGYCFYLDGEEVETLASRKTYSIGLKVYTITTPAESEIGSVVADAETATIGTEVTLTVYMADEYVLDTLIVNGTDVAAQVEDGQYIFDMPAADVTVSVTFKLRKAVVFMNGEEEWAKVLASDNGTIMFAGMPVPTKDGSNFAGWFTADGTMVYHGMPVNEDMTAFATWLTVKSAENGELSYSKDGAEVKVTATPADGYELDTLTVTDAEGNPVEVTDGKFTLTGSDVTVSATFKKTVYTVTVKPSFFGDVLANKTTVKAGDTVTLTIAPDHEYALASLVVLDASGNEVKLNGYTFVMPESNVTVTATFEEIKIHPVSLYFKGNVKLEGGELAGGSCKFVLKDDTGRVIETVKCDENGDFEFKPVSFYGPVTNYGFTLSQIVGDEAGVVYDEKVHEVYVTVINPGDGYLEAEIIGSLKAEFINKYTAPEVSE